MSGVRYKYPVLTTWNILILREGNLSVHCFLDIQLDFAGLHRQRLKVYSGQTSAFEFCDSQALLASEHALKFWDGKYTWAPGDFGYI